MKRVITQAQLQATIAEAKTIPGMRLGQHVWNKFCDGTALEDSARLFYCDDSEFWTVVFDYITVEG